MFVICVNSCFRERATGLIDVLSTLPNVRGVHSTFAWCLCGACWVLLSTGISLVFFYAVLLHTPALLPALTLGLLGVVLCKFFIRDAVLYLVR